MFLDFIGTNGKYVNRQCGGGGEFKENETLLVLDYNLFNDYKDYTYVKIQKDLKTPSNIYKINKVNYYDDCIIIEIEKFTDFQVKSIRDFFTED